MEKSKSEQWTVADFERLRVALTLFVNSEIVPLIEDAVCRRILVEAAVKSGKKDIVEYIAMRDKGDRPTRSHAFVSSWHRTADEEQRDELSNHNLTVFSMTNQANVDKFNRWLDEQITQGRQIVIHIDECDYGSGAKQTLNKVWSKIRGSEMITAILYSATPEEVLFSEEVDTTDEMDLLNQEFREGEKVTYIPPEGYCGAERFLREGLVYEAMPFFEKGEPYRLSSQAKNILVEMKRHMVTDPKRNILVLRLSGSFIGEKESKNNKMMDHFLNHIDDFPELDGVLIHADKSDKKKIKNKRIILETIPWSNENYWKGKANGVLLLYVIDQTCSRSTELKCHDRIYAEHDYRNTIQYNTVCQAQLRVTHYEQKYEGFQPIRIYGSVSTFKLAAGQIDYPEYLTHKLKKKKIDVRTSPVEKYKVLYSDNRLHSSCGEEGLDEADADRILQEHGCFAKISISPRIDGSVREVRVYDKEWIKTSPETWDRDWSLYAEQHGMKPKRSPFIASAFHRKGTIWPGQHRGWKQLDYIDGELYEVVESGHKKIDIGSTGGERTKICYHHGELGVLAVHCIGRKSKNTLHTVKSMYN